MLAVALLLLAPADPVATTSPDGRVCVQFALRGAVPHYRVRFRDAEAVGWSPLGLDLAGGTLGGRCEVVGVTTAARRERFTQVPGKRRDVLDHHTETVVRLREGDGRRWEVVLRAADDGIALRYRVPAQPGLAELVVAGERTRFHLPPAAAAVALPLDGFTTSHENRYLRRPVGDLPAGQLFGLPLLAECAPGTWAAVAEADASDSAGLYLTPAGGGLAARLSPLPGEPAVAMRSALPFQSAWRVVLLGDGPGRLAESDLVLCLNPPCAVADTGWIKPGKTTFPWWNGFHEENVPFQPGLNTATAKYYLDFCAAAGIPYHSLDGLGDEAWYGGPIVPYRGADITRGGPNLDLQAVLAHAKAKGVRVRLWMHWQAAERHMARAFPLYRQWGVEGVMVDFMDRDDQPMNRFLRRLVALAADNRLTVTLHGVSAPTGLERTFPNLLTHEGVYNLEHNKWNDRPVTPDHELTVPFTRMLAGPLDFHQGSLRAVRPAAFRPRVAAPLVVGTPARTLAGYVVYQNHLPMVADYPTAYRRHPALSALAEVPCTWDDTTVLQAEVGGLAVVARRSGDRWYVGAMTAAARTVSLPLGFLPAGRFTATLHTDDLAATPELRVRTREVSNADTLSLPLAEAGGAFVRLAPGGLP